MRQDMHGEDESRATDRGGLAHDVVDALVAVQQAAHKISDADGRDDGQKRMDVGRSLDENDDERDRAALDASQQRRRPSQCVPAGKDTTVHVRLEVLACYTTETATDEDERHENARRYVGAKGEHKQKHREGAGRQQRPLREGRLWPRLRQDTHNRIFVMPPQEGCHLVVLALCTEELDAAGSRGQREGDAGATKRLAV